MAFILHNPSIASDCRDDPTARRGAGFANALNSRTLIFVNAATGVATDANGLSDIPDPIGPCADYALRVAAHYVRSRGGVLIAAWGAPKGRVATRKLMLARFEAIKALRLPLHVMRLTGSGYPEHLLYLPGNLRPAPWNYA